MHENIKKKGFELKFLIIPYWVGQGVGHTQIIDHNDFRNLKKLL